MSRRVTIATMRDPSAAICGAATLRKPNTSAAIKVRLIAQSFTRAAVVEPGPATARIVRFIIISFVESQPAQETMLRILDQPQAASVPFALPG